MSLVRGVPLSYEWHCPFPDGVPLEFLCPTVEDRIIERNRRLNRSRALVVRTMYKKVEKERRSGK